MRGDGIFRALMLDHGAIALYRQEICFTKGVYEQGQDIGGTHKYSIVLMC